jgi:uncharacterized protein YjbI with pentapeptide repeats
MAFPDKPHRIVRWLRKPLSRSTIIVALSITVVASFHQYLFPGGLGIGKGQTVTTTTETTEKDKRGNVVKSVEVTKSDDGKTVWDWLSLLGVPLSLAILGAWLQHNQQERAEKFAEEQKNRDEKFAEEQRGRDEKLASEQRKLAADETKEEVLQGYFDRISALLVDKNLLAIASKLDASRLYYTDHIKVTPPDKPTLEQQELLDSAVDVIRARTLSILRRFENDGERKASVIRFLIEADIVSKLNLNLRDADLSDAYLNGANLTGAELSRANLTGANLEDANLSRANLTGAYLDGAYLSRANLTGAYLDGAYLVGANLSRATLEDANLSRATLEDANLSRATLEDANLSRATLVGANLGFANLEGAKLGFANLERAKNLTEIQLDQAYLCDTTLPDYLSGVDPNRDCNQDYFAWRFKNLGSDAD